MPAVPRGPVGAASRRTLGEGRHPVAAGVDGFAVATVSIEADGARVELSLFTADGKRGSVVRVDDPEADLPAFFANPVVAALPGSGYIVAWTDYLADGDELGVALRKVSPDGRVGPRRVASSDSAFSQYDADMVWTAAGLVVSWVDDSNWLTAPDLRYRTFDEQLVPIGSEAILAETDAVEANVALAAYDDTWAAAWHTSAEMDEYFSVFVASTGARWDLEPGSASPAYDRPALAQLGSGELGVLYTRGEDRTGSGIAEHGALTLARLRETEAAPTYSDVRPLHDDYASDESVSVSQPNLVALAGNHVYAGWRTSPLLGDGRGDNTWIKRIAEDGALTLLDPEVPSPRLAADQLGDQRALAFATRGGPRFPMLVSAWDDYGRDPKTGAPTRDVLVQYAQVPLVRGEDRVAWRRETPQLDLDAGTADAGQGQPSDEPLDASVPLDP